MQGHRVFKVFRVFVAISDLRVIQDAKARKEISDLKVRREIPVLPDLQGHRAILDLRDPEVSRVLPDRLGLPDLWDRKV